MPLLFLCSSFVFLFYWNCLPSPHNKNANAKKQSRNVWITLFEYELTKRWSRQPEQKRRTSWIWFGAIFKKSCFVPVYYHILIVWKVRKKVFSSNGEERARMFITCTLPEQLLGKLYVDLNPPPPLPLVDKTAEDCGKYNIWF